MISGETDQRIRVAECLSPQPDGVHHYIFLWRAGDFSRLLNCMTAKAADPWEPYFNVADACCLAKKSLRLEMESLGHDDEVV